MSDKVPSPEEINSIWEKASEIADLELTDEANLEKVKSVICNFYEHHPERKKPVSIGGCSGCKTCPIEHVAECRDAYLSTIYDKPQLKWDKEFDEPIIREKISVSERMLGLKCATCHVKHRCPQYKANSLCSIDWEERDVNELSNKDIVNKMIDLQYKRVTRETMFEDIEGGKADPTVSIEIDRLTGLVGYRNNLDTRHAKLTIEASETIPESDNRQGTSLLASLFGGGGTSDNNELPTSDGDIIDITGSQPEPEKVGRKKEPKTPKKKRRGE